MFCDACDVRRTSVIESRRRTSTRCPSRASRQAASTSSSGTGDNTSPHSYKKVSCCPCDHSFFVILIIVSVIVALVILVLLFFLLLLLLFFLFLSFLFFCQRKKDGWKET